MADKSRPRRIFKGSMQDLLRTYFVVFAFALLAIVVLVVAQVQYRYSRKDIMDNLHRTSSSVADSVGQQINQMNQVTLNAISSTDLQDTFLRYISEDLSAYEHNRLRQRLANYMASAKGLDFSVRQLNIYTPVSGDDIVKGFGQGEFNGDFSRSAEEMPWYEETTKASGRMVISAFEDNMSTGGRSSHYIAVSHMFYNIFHVPVGYVEVRKTYQDVFSQADVADRSYQADLFVYDSGGRRLYPVGDEEYFDYFSCAGTERDVIVNEMTGSQEYVSFSESENSGLVVVSVVENSIVTGHILRQMIWIIAIFAVLFVIALVVSVLLAKQLSSPIRSIYHFLSDESREPYSLLEQEPTGIREIDKLTASINEDIRSNKAAADTMMTLKEQEVQAQMLALQSQMNPHFLYNSLATLGEMAEEGYTKPVAEMCRQITEILRYISSNREQRSSLEEELEICDMYLQCIHMRYGDQLIGEISAPDHMLDIQIPKLCTQLLVENAIRSVTTQAPPWRVSVECKTEDGKWYVTVRDNGPGFDEEVDRRLRAQMDEILKTGVLPSLKIQGMGILNIFIRLYLLDGIPFIFDMGNNPDGGAFVTIGGKYTEESAANKMGEETDDERD